MTVKEFKYVLSSLLKLYPYLEDYSIHIVASNIDNGGPKSIYINDGYDNIELYKNNDEGLYIKPTNRMFIGA
jgi:hypothetical protein